MATTINGSAGVTTNTGAVYNGLQSGTAVTATGTSVDFTGIPSWVKRITVMFNGVSTNGASPIQIQIGSGSITTTGYVSGEGGVTTASAARVTSTTGLIVAATSAISTSSGVHTIYLLSGTNYVSSGVIDNSGGAVTCSSAGTITLSATLDRIRITTVNGTDTFDAGTINIIYE